MEQISVIAAGVCEQQNTDFDAQMKELCSLAEACGLCVAETFTQKLSSRNPASYFGAGRLLELKERLEELDVHDVILLHECTPAQLRTMERTLGAQVSDRTLLILKIFAQRARTKEARLQVEMAMCQYELPRLIGAHAHLGRQSGGRNKGSGEQQLALDKRALQQRISALRRQLAQLSKKQTVQHASRSRSPYPRVALVGYTNAGKSTILNQLLSLSKRGQKKQVFAQDMLFATLDTSVRLIDIPPHQPFLLSDTVGFLNDLPHTLIEAFDATLSEAKEADLLLHVVDAADPQHDVQMQTTLDTLQKIGCADSERLTVMNKIDRCEDTAAHADGGRVWISASTADDMELLLCALDQLFLSGKIALTWLFPYAQAHLLPRLHAHAALLQREDTDEGIRMRGYLDPAWRTLFRAYEKADEAQR